MARLNFIQGNVSIQPAGADEWGPAVINRPLTTGDNLWTDVDTRAELHLNNAALHLSSQTAVGVLNLDDRMAQFRFSEGEMVLRVRRMRDYETFEVDTPNAAITILREGVYRFTADPDSGNTSVAVRRGNVEVTAGGQAFNVATGSSAQIQGTDQISYDVEYAVPADDFEGWARDRDAREDHSMSARYLPPDVIGYEDLDAYGSWRTAEGYGAVWYPSVAPGWAPYHDGHWAWIEPWGWSWVDDAAWGFAPSHYGRWAYIDNAWGWVPGPLSIAGGGAAVITPIYAPALVAFIGGGGFGMSLSIGGAAVGWVPLGPGEVYTPAYAMSAAYFRNVNVSSTVIVNNVNITNVYNNVYVNKTAVVNNQNFANMRVANAVTAMPQNAFASGRPVTQVGVRVSAAQIAQIRTMPMALAPPVAPTRQALTPMATSRPVVQPPARVAALAVVAKVTPPAAPVPFAAKQAVLQQNLGRPLNMQAVRQVAAPPQRVMTPLVRVAPPAHQITVAPRPQGSPMVRPPAAQVQQSMPASHPSTPAPPAAPGGYRPAPAPQSMPASHPPAAPQQPAPAYRPVPAPTPQSQPQYHPPAAPPPQQQKPAPPAQPKPAPKPPPKPKTEKPE